MIGRGVRNHLNTPYHPLCIYPSATTHKANDVQTNKRGFGRRGRKKLHYDLRINLSKESGGIRCRDQRDINTTAVPP